MSWEHSFQIIDMLLGSALIAKLFLSGLYKEYRIFWLFLVVDLLGSYAWIAAKFFPTVDYRIVWLCTSLPVWALTVSMVYSHMEKILVNLPGLAKLSQKVLNVACISAVSLGIISALFEYGAWGLWNTEKIRICLTAGGIILARMFASIALLVFVAILTFLLWFPVSVRKNVATMTLGLLVYFASKTTFLLARGAWSETSVRLVSFWITVVSSLCFAYWIIEISAKGEKTPSPLRVPWRHADKERLVRQLELLDQSLAHAARR